MKTGSVKKLDFTKLKEVMEKFHARKDKAKQSKATAIKASKAKAKSTARSVA